LSTKSARERGNFQCREERKRGWVLTELVAGGGPALRDLKLSCAQPGGGEEWERREAREEGRAHFISVEECQTGQEIVGIHSRGRSYCAGSSREISAR
jgi:hypothetical protein